MRVVDLYNHHSALSLWSDRGLADWLQDVFEVPNIRVEAQCKKVLRAHVRHEFQMGGWALTVKIDQGLGLSIFAMREDLAFHLQTGNISRAAYDLLKLQHLYQSKRIESAALALPTREAAAQLGSNIAYSDRIVKELEVFNRVITVPIVVVAFA